MKARDFRALARQALSGRWGVAVLTGFLAALLGGTMASSGSSGSGGSSVYMCPAYYCTLSHFPLTVNGKADIMKFPTLSGPH